MRPMRIRRVVVSHSEARPASKALSICSATSTGIRGSLRSSLLSETASQTLAMMSSASLGLSQQLSTPNRFNFFALGHLSLPSIQGAIASRIHRLCWRAMGVSDFKSFAAMSLSSVTEQCVSAALAWAGRAALGEPLSHGPTLVPMLLCAAGTAAMMGFATCARHTGLNT